ncbi:DNA damage-inducible protein 1 [Ascosphaera pollenicola]|nr:DNA damage-inducible protein 1 [Ascosphaera pollenicola]
MPQLQSRRGVGVGVDGSFAYSVDDSGDERSDAAHSAASSNRRTRYKPRYAFMDLIKLHYDHYMGNLEPSQLYELSMYLLQVQHKWSISNFLRAMVLEENSRNTYTKSKRREHLASMVFDDPDVAEALLDKLDFKSHFAWLFIQKLEKQMVWEFEKVGEQPGMGVFKPTVMPEKLRLDNLDKRVVRVMPAFHAVVSPLMKSKEGRDRPNETPFLTLVSIIARCRHRQLNNNFPMMLGLYLHSLGLKRRALTVLHGLGLIPSYRRLMLNLYEIVRFTVTVLPQLPQQYRRRFLICWDNFDYRDDVHHVTAANQGNHICTTTGLFLESLVIPPEGISLSDFKPEVLLDQYHLLDHGVIQTDETEKKLQAFWIFQALRSVYETEIDPAFEKTPALHASKPAFPFIKTLGKHKTVHRELGPIKYNESTLSRSFEVIEDIFKRICQLKETDAAFKESI